MTKRLSRSRATYFEQVPVDFARSRAYLAKRATTADVPKNLIFESASQKTLPYSMSMERRMRPR
jgi:hypothetical protein